MWRRFMVFSSISGPFHERFFQTSYLSYGNFQLCPALNYNKMIAVNFGTRFNIYSVMKFAKFCCDLIAMHGTTTKYSSDMNFVGKIVYIMGFVMIAVLIIMNECCGTSYDMNSPPPTTPIPTPNTHNGQSIARPRGRTFCIFPVALYVIPCYNKQYYKLVSLITRTTTSLPLRVS